MPYTPLMVPALQTLMLSLQQQGGIPEATPCLFLGAQPHHDLPRHVTGWQPFKPAADAWVSAGHELFEDLPQGTRFPLVLILPGKSRDETLVWFALARDHLAPGGRIVVAMPNTAGAARFEKELKKATGEITSLSKNKCRAFQAEENNNWDDATFSAWRSLGIGRAIPGTRYLTEPGIFSSEHIDTGSQLLVDHIPSDLSGHVADLGAGWGYLSDQILKRCGAITRLDLYEADSRALKCARNNLSGHHAELGFHWHDVTCGIRTAYDAIVMNPPFHSGQATDIDLGQSFITTAAAALKPGGRLFIVANRQLPYEHVLDSLRLRWHQATDTPTFKLLFASKS